MQNTIEIPDIATPKFNAEAWLQDELQTQASLRLHWAMSVNLWRLFLIGGFLAIWEASAAWGWVDTFFVSRPSAVATFLMDSFGRSAFWADIYTTIAQTLIGVGLSAVAGIFAAFLLAQSEKAQQILDPVLSFLNSLPRVAFAPLFVAFFGLGMLSKIVLAFSLCFFIILEGALTGMKGIDPDLDTLTRQLGASRYQYFFKLALPNALPSIFSALRLALVYGFLAVVVGEMIGANRGIGQQIAFYSGVLRTDAVFGLLLVLGVIASTLAASLRSIENRLLRWR